MRAADYLGPDGPLARALPDYEERPAQAHMAAEVEAALEDHGIALVEAGTGTGKTLAYLIPAILSGKKVVVSTGTKTLQDQLMEHDLPWLSAHLGVPFEAACMKGLANYLCLRRYEEFVSSPEADRGENARHLKQVRELRAGSEYGERAELVGVPENAPVWAQVNSGSDTRIGARCRYYDSCFVTRMRRTAEQADIIVVNHHLYFADLATRGPHGGGAIPEHDAVIFDEAHQIEDVVTEFFGVQVSTARVEVLVRDAQRAFTRVRLEDMMFPVLDDVLTSASVFFGSLPRGRSGDLGRQPLPAERFAGEVEENLHRLDATLEVLVARSKLYSPEGEAIAQIAKRAQQVRDDVATIAYPDGSDRGRHVTWTETRGRSVSIGASPVDASEILREKIFHRGEAAVLTSATLTTGGDFEFVKGRLGVDFEVSEVSLPSPFDYAQQAALYLPRGVPDPRSEAYVAAASEQIRELVQITGGGAFVLCTSLRMMNLLHRTISPQLEQTVLVQGQAPKNELLERFRDSGHAVLFASASFWEGVDVPGDALRLVVIDKLPFEVPSDPLVKARCERLEERQENAFMRYLVPNAALALKQGFGRLVRSSRDRGIVAVLDPRLTQKGYGRVFLKTLPPARRCDSLDEVREFWASHVAGEPGEE